MNKLSLYVLLILLFLGLSKSFSPSSQKSTFIPSKEVLSSVVQGAPATVILEDMFKAGFLIKTHYLKLKIIHAFKAPQTVIVRAPQKYWEKNKNNIGMSLFRRAEKDDFESSLPMPPGTLFVGNRSFGRWKYRNSGQKVWSFHKVYRHFSGYFSWGEFVPTYQFYKKMKIYIDSNTPFYGLNNEFGTNGSITQKMDLGTMSKKRPPNLRPSSILKKYFSIPNWKNI